MFCISRRTVSSSYWQSCYGLYDIWAPVDETGKEIEVDLSDDAFEPGANTIPKPLRVKQVGKGDEMRRTVEREAMDASSNGYVLSGVKAGQDRT
jgi:hypothetical protein